MQNHSGPVIVLGMHRSGTSLVAGLLHKMGINMGPGCEWKAIDNPSGFYEDSAFIGLNEQIFAILGHTWDNPPSQEKVRGIAKAANVRDAAMVLVEMRSNDQSWGWKDPRTAITLPIYMEFVGKPSIIVVHRNPLSIAQSLFKRNGMPLKKALELNCIYEMRILDFLKEYAQLPQIHFAYEHFFLTNRSSQEVDKLAEFVGMKANGKIYDFVNSTLKHF